MRERHLTTRQMLEADQAFLKRGTMRRKPRIEQFHVNVTQDKGGEFRWGLFAANGVQVGTIGEGNKKRAHVLRMVHRVFASSELQLVRNILGQALLSLDRAEQKGRINEALDVLDGIQKRVTVKE